MRHRFGVGWLVALLVGLLFTAYPLDLQAQDVATWTLSHQDATHDVAVQSLGATGELGPQGLLHDSAPATQDLDLLVVAYWTAASSDTPSRNVKPDHVTSTLDLHASTAALLTRRHSRSLVPQRSLRLTT